MHQAIAGKVDACKAAEAPKVLNAGDAIGRQVEVLEPMQLLDSLDPGYIVTMQAQRPQRSHAEEPWHVRTG